MRCQNGNDDVFSARHRGS